MAINLFGRQSVWGGDLDSLDEDADKLDIPIHAFDVVTADECHRGYTSAEVSLWRNTLEHFDAVKIGLTATPAFHTTSYFKEVVFRYGYERAVSEGYLVDYDAVAIRSDVRMKGIFLQEGEQVGRIDTTTGAERALLPGIHSSHTRAEVWSAYPRIGPVLNTSAPVQIQPLAKALRTAAP